MRKHYFKIAKLINKILPLEQCSQISSQKMILPFYHTVSASPAAHFAELGYFRDKEIFENDLDFFTDNFESLELKDLDLSKKGFHLTFDDGLAENYSVVAQMLYIRKIHATFFINLDFIDNKRMFIRHKISLILREIRDSEFDRKTISELLEVDETLLHDKINTLKNENEVNEIADRLGIDFENYLQEHQPYLSLNELKEMMKMGFTIGNHCSSHARFSEITFENQKEEVQLVNEFLNKELSIDELYFCFPFGDDLINNEFFNWLYSEGQILKSFGTAGLKKDYFANHYHRILFEDSRLSAEEIVKFEYFYYFIKSFLNKNIISR